VATRTHTQRRLREVARARDTTRQPSPNWAPSAADSITPAPRSTRAPIDARGAPRSPGLARSQAAQRLPSRLVRSRWPLARPHRVATARAPVPPARAAARRPRRGRAARRAPGAATPRPLRVRPARFDSFPARPAQSDRAVRRQARAAPIARPRHNAPRRVARVRRAPTAQGLAPPDSRRVSLLPPRDRDGRGRTTSARSADATRRLLGLLATGPLAPAASRRGGRATTWPARVTSRPLDCPTPSAPPA